MALFRPMGFWGGDRPMGLCLEEGLLYGIIIKLTYIFITFTTNIQHYKANKKEFDKRGLIILGAQKNSN